MIGFAFALISAMSFGISNAYWKTAAKHDDFARLVLFRGLLTTAALGIAWLLLLQWPTAGVYLINSSANAAAYAKTIGLCFACSLGLLFYLRSLQYTAVSIAVPLSSINVFSILTAVIVLGEVVRWPHLLSFVLVVAGVCLVQAFSFSEKSISWNRGATYALLASFFWGTTYALFRFPSSWMGAVPLAFILELCVTCSAAAWLMLSSKKVIPYKAALNRNNIRHYCILALLLLAGTLFFNLAIQRVPILLLNVTGSFTVVVSVACSALFYKEKLGRRQFIGIVLLIASLLVVQIWG